MLAGLDQHLSGCSCTCSIVKDKELKESRLVLNGKAIQLKETRRGIRAESQFFKVTGYSPNAWCQCMCIHWTLNLFCQSVTNRRGQFCHWSRASNYKAMLCKGRHKGFCDSTFHCNVMLFQERLGKSDVFFCHFSTAFLTTGNRLWNTWPDTI